MYSLFHKQVERLAHFLALLGFTGLLVLSMMIVADIILRSVIDFPLQGVNDVSAVVMALVISACIPQSLLIKQSITVDILGQILGNRANLFLNAFASLAVLIFFVLMVTQFFPYAADLTDSGERTWVLKWPTGPWWYAASVCFTVSAVVQFLVFIDDTMAALMGRTDLLTDANSDGSL